MMISIRKKFSIPLTGESYFTLGNENENLKGDLSH